MRRLPLGVLGFGRLGSLHARNIARYPGAELIAVCDPDPLALDRAESEYSPILLTRDLDYFLALPIEGVVIATNTEMHLEHIRAVARAGKAIFTEKPVGLTLVETDTALQEVVNADVPFQIGFQRRWDARYRQARSLIENGQIGEPVLFKAFGRDPSASDPANWGLGKNGGIFLNCAIHDFDAARYLLGQEVDWVTATGGALVHTGLVGFGDADTASTTMFFSGGAMAMTEWSRYAAYGYDVGMEVVGTGGVIRFRSSSSTPNALMLNNTGLVVHTPYGRTPTVFTVFEEAFQSAIEGFVDAVAAGRNPSPGVQDARVSLQVALAARASFEWVGERVPVRPLPPLVRRT